MTRELMRTIVVGVAGLGVLGQLAILALLLAAIVAAIGRPEPLASIRRRLHGLELWLAFAVATFSTASSLFFSEVAQFPPCSICWYERYCMYPLSFAMLILAAFRPRRAVWWVLPVPIVGAGLSIWHVLIENGLAPQTLDCLASSPGGCGLKWINEFGYVTIPTLALTGFSLLIALLLLHLTGEAEVERADQSGRLSAAT